LNYRLNYQQREVEHITAEDGEKLGPFRVEGIGWPFSSFYSFISQGRLINDIHESATQEVSAGVSKGKILDMGTGPGRLPVKIALKNPNLEVYGVDLSDAMIKIAELNAIKAGVSQRVEFKVGSVYSLPYENDFFDMVVSTLSFHHWSEPIIGLNEIYRVLKPGGECWIYEIRQDLPQDAREEARKRYGWFLGALGLRFVRLHSSTTMDKAKRLEMDSRLVFKNPEVEGRGILLRMRFKKENEEINLKN
jgi:ubiquinone/menaquinone biosynthesis C-methylase UbiE